MKLSEEAPMKERHSPGRDRLTIAREAGLSRFSVISVLAGTVTAYGTFSVVAAIAGSLLAAAGVKSNFRTNDWSGSGAVAALVTALVLLIAYLFGGYVAGRMARRSGILHGVAVFVLSLVIGAIAGGVVSQVSNSDSLKQNLRSIGVPTTTDQISGVAVAGVILSIVAMLVGAVVGAKLGERWHTRLAQRVADPNYGPGAELRQRADETDRRSEHSLDRDAAIRREIDLSKERDDKERDEEARRDEARRDEARDVETRRVEPRDDDGRAHEARDAGGRDDVEGTPQFREPVRASDGDVEPVPKSSDPASGAYRGPSDKSVEE